MRAMDANDNDLVVEIVGTLNLRFKHLNPSVYYEVRFEESGLLLSCGHQHVTTEDAAKCRLISPAGSFVFAVKNGKSKAASA